MKNNARISWRLYAAAVLGLLAVGLGMFSVLKSQDLSPAGIWKYFNPE